jgi:tetratricopeptide (TPR) repeat protein
MKPFEEPNSAADSTPCDNLSSSATFDPKPLLEAFEQAWQSGNRPPIETMLTRLPAADPASESDRRRVLVEMVKIDLEYRWRAATEDVDDDLPARPFLEDYLRRYPALGPPDRLSLELIGEEYRVRRRWGDRPERDSYYTRFPTHDELPSLLARIDAELAERSVFSTLLTTEMKGAAPLPREAAPDGYEILGELGRGGMGVVYKARQLRLNRLVAIKMIRAGEESGRAALARFRTEAEAAARVQDPHVVQVYEVGDKNGHPFCVMEYVNGGSLAQRLAGAPLEPCVAARLMETLARAVQAIHDQGILHRDLKPSNILLHVSPAVQSTTVTSALLQSPACVPKISDFGLAKPAEAVGLTQTGAVLGTPSYMAPEQAESRSDAIGVSADVYGLGAILYEMLTGRPPFRGVTVLQTLEQVRNQEPLPPRQLQPAVPLDLETICLKCLQKEPTKRYASAAELANDLERFRQNLPIQARPVSRWERGFKWARRRPALATLGAAIVFGMIAALVGGLTYTLQLSAAHEETERQRQQAGRSYNKALEAVQQMLVRMGAERVEAIPGTEDVQVEALKDAIRLCQDLQKEQEQPDPDLYTRLGFALTYLGNRQMALGLPDEAEENCRRGMEVLDNLPPELRDTPACHHQSAFARYILANILAAKNHRAGAKRLYLEACEILTSLGDAHAERELLTHCYTGLGQLDGNPALTRKYYRQAVEQNEFLRKDDPDNWHYRNQLGQSLYNLAHNNLFNGNAEEAETLFQRCTDLLEPFAERGPGSKDQPSQRVVAQNILFHCYSGLGILWSNRGVADKAESFHLKAITLGERLALLYPHPPQRGELAQSYVTLVVHCS